MKHYIIIRYTLITTLAALAISALSFQQPQVYARGQGNDRILTGFIFNWGSVGLVPGQSLRLTLFNPDDTPAQVQARVHHSGGAFFLFGDGSVRSGAFRSFDLKRSNIPLPGEDRTGRLQLLATMTVNVAEPPTKIDKFAASLEIVEESTGRTDGTSNTILVGEVVPIGGTGRDILVGGSSNDFLVGIVPGQTLRITLFHQPTVGNARRQAVGARVKMFDENGNLIAQSADLPIPPGGFRFFAIDRLALPLPGEPGTDRLQVRAHVEIMDPFSFTSDGRASGLLLASMELIENSTGETTVQQNNYNPFITIDVPSR